MGRQRRLSPLEALEGVVQLLTSLVVILGQALAHRIERVHRDARVGGNRTNGGSTNPHPEILSTGWENFAGFFPER